EISLVSPTLVEAGGAATTRALAHFARRHELAGVEFLAGIPGRVGGAVIMNAGAYGGDIGQVLVAARVMDLQGQLHWSTASDLGLGYRKSRIPAGWVVVGARFQLHPTSGEMIRQRMREMNRKRSGSQPLAWPSAGSTFKNPDSGEKAWALIEKAGMRGVRIGGAQVAEKHCNFLINLDNASGEDMRRLIRLVTQRVWETSGILLELEVKVVESDGRAWSP
ncbi:MAG: UDP-N-acetylmuramate dehydrogenase, partial [Magnetococcales bacterium]|nr:UDP-N-acetylmuramate dehydrogenase [Magnetococcales bacterium]